MKRQMYVVALLAGWLLAGAAGCVRPGPLDPSLVARYQRELAGRGPQRRQGTEGLAALEPVTRLPGLKITKVPQTGALRVELSLDQAVQRHLANSPEIRVVSYDPAITREDAIQAAALFDLVAFGGWSYTKQDNRTDSVFSSGQSRNRLINAGVRKRTVTGANVEAAWSWSRSWSNSNFQTLNTRHEPSLTFEVSQPLLRDFGPTVNLAQMRVAQLNYQASGARFRQKLEEFVTRVITIYLRLVQSRGDVEIEQKLLDVTIETLNRIRKRVDVDATAVQIKQAESAVESRRARLIRAKKVVLDVQDELVRLIADKDLNLLGAVEILPSTGIVAVKVTLNSTDQLALALNHSPVLEEARRAIDVADITVKVAKNQTLPRLDLQASGELQGLARNFHEANRYLEETAPWQTIKADAEAARGQLSAAIEAARILLVYLKPIVPAMVEKAERCLAVEPLAWPDIERVPPARQLGTFERLAERVDASAIEAMIEETRADQAAHQ